MKTVLAFCFGIFLSGAFLVSCSDDKAMDQQNGSIKPYSENPFYWQYKDEPVLLLGGTWQDNLFNHPDGLKEHLDKLVQCGGNYVRNTMSHRNEGNVFAYAKKEGCASARFHRPHPLEGGPENHYKLSMHGLGLHPQAQANITSARKFLEAINIFTCRPNNQLLGERSENEAYCVAEKGKQYGIYFPLQGEVTLDLSDAEGNWNVKWLNISKSEWFNQEELVKGGKWVQIETPEIDHCVAVLLPANQLNRLSQGN